ncbi:MAG: hypothetical protein AABZ08_06335 [Planctomycetota bacterium]|mgnify:CR=1 FL=1
MFPPFVDSFGDQASAVFINAIGTIFGGFFTAIIGAFVNAFLSPLFKSLAAGVGVTA